MADSVNPQFLRIKNWEKFQHYKDRRPPWIKYHVALLDDHRLLGLPPLTQLVYDRLLLRAALTDNNIEHDPDWLGKKFNLDPVMVQEGIVDLIDAGFLMVAERKRSASAAIARRKQVAKPETETEKRQKAEAKAEEQVQVQRPLVIDIAKTIDKSLREAS